jgi:hypothetical protein
MLVKIAVNESEEHCLALTARSELLHIDLNAAYDDEEVIFDVLMYIQLLFRSVLRNWTCRKCRLISNFM